MRPQPTPTGTGGYREGVTNLTLGTAVVLLCATLTRPTHGVAALLCVVLLVLRLERTGGEG